VSGRLTLALISLSTSHKTNQIAEQIEYLEASFSISRLGRPSLTGSDYVQDEIERRRFRKGSLISCGLLLGAEKAYIQRSLSLEFAVVNSTR
jgi:hypothetical protein